MTGFLMCPPDFFSIDYEINPWMHIENKSKNNKAKDQWQNLYNLLKNEIKAEIKLIKPQKGLPDMVFTANAALIYKNKAIISKFRYPQRQGEEKFFKDWFKENNYEVIELPDEMCFEGAGDALFCDDILYAGYIPRTDITSHTYIAELLKIKIISLELVDKRYYHLDTCFCPLDNGHLIYYPKAFDKYGNAIIESNFNEDKLIELTDEESLCFSANAVNIGQHVVMNITTERLKHELEQKGFTLHEIRLDEYMKSGGSSKCLTLKL